MKTLLLIIISAVLSGCATGSKTYKLNRALWGAGNWDEVKEYQYSDLNGYEYIEATKYRSED